MSLRIIINNQEARLPESSEIEIKLTNTFFNDREEDATYPLSLNVAANRHIFKFSDRFDSDDFTTKYDAKVYFGPYCLLDGHCIVTDISGSEIEVYITTANTSFWGRAKKGSLHQLELGEERFSSIDSMMTAFTESLHGGKDYVVCPLFDAYIKTEYPTLYDHFGTYYNYLPLTTTTDSKFVVEIPDTDNDKCIFTPFLRLSKLIKKVLAALGYNIIRNDIDKDTMFNDIIVVCRRNGMHTETITPSFEWKKHVPAILISDFLQEIENKFGIQFRVNEASKNVSIISNNRLDQDIHLEARDLVQKYSIDEDDQKQDFIFKDKDSPDAKIQKYYGDEDGNNNSLTYISGNEEDADSIECISNIVGWFDPPTTSTSILSKAVMAVEGTYEENIDYKTTILSEFRLSVYRGYIACRVAANLAPLPYPIASAEPLDSDQQTNNISLLWSAPTTPYAKTLFTQYHSRRIAYMSKINREYQFILKHSLNDLVNFHNYFSSCLVIRNQRYRCYEINIKLSNKKIVEHIVKCYPA